MHIIIKNLEFYFFLIVKNNNSTWKKKSFNRWGIVQRR